MTKARVAKVLGWAQFVIVYAQQVVASQSALPTNAKGWLALLASLLLGAAVHHASSTEGTK